MKKLRLSVVKLIVQDETSKCLIQDSNLGLYALYQLYHIASQHALIQYLPFIVFLSNI